jgi:hypothetical protein
MSLQLLFVWRGSVVARPLRDQTCADKVDVRLMKQSCLAARV